MYSIIDGEYDSHQIYLDYFQGFCQECLRGGVQNGWGVWGTPPGEKKSEFLNFGAQNGLF